MAVVVKDLTGQDPTGQDPANERDPEWVARHRAGDDQAFAELYERYHARLVAFCSRRVRDSHLAEEFAQEAFIQAFQALSGLRKPYHVYPWLTVIARRLIIDHQRREDRQRREIHLDQATEPGLDELWISRAEAEQVRMALDRVRERHREVLYLRDFEGLSYEEVAARIGTPVTTIPPLLHRARLALRREYLAVTQHDRVAAVLPLFAGLLSLPRRVRDRVMQTLSHLPDLSGLSAPAASVVFSMATVLSPGMAPSPQATAPEAGWIPAAEWHRTGPGPAKVGAAGDPPAATRDSDLPPATTATTAPPPKREVVAGLVQWENDEETVEQRRERTSEMPVYVEIEPTGGTFVGADPGQMRRDVTSPQWWKEQAQQANGG